MLELDIVYGYIYNKDGYHTPPIKMSTEAANIANFIMKSEEAPVVIITNSNDEMEIRPNMVML